MNGSSPSPPTVACLYCGIPPEHAPRTGRATAAECSWPWSRRASTPSPGSGARSTRPPSRYLTFSFVPGAGTMLADLAELHAGHRLDVDVALDTVSVTRWFVHEVAPTPSWGEPEHVWVSRTRAAVEQAVAERLPAGESVVTFLSGGLDSSIVTTVAARQRRAAGDPPPISLSLHFGVDVPNELPYARAVAAMAGTDHMELEIRPSDLDSLLRRMVWHLDEPIGDPVTIGNFLLAETAASSARWVLNGEGGDPVFGGPKNLPMLLGHWYTPDGDLERRTGQYLATGVGPVKTSVVSCTRTSVPPSTLNESPVPLSRPTSQPTCRTTS